MYRYVIGLWFLVALPLGVAAQQGSVNLTPTEFNEAVSGKKNVVVLDVRTVEEVREGHIQDAVNIDIQSEKFEETIAGLDKDKSYFVYCRSGSRSERAIEVMKDMGFKKIYNLDGGFLAWKEKELPWVAP